MTLEMAWPYKAQLIELRAKTAVDPTYYWWRAQGYATWDEKEFEHDTWRGLQMVSLNSSREIVGWLDAEFSRASQAVSSLSIARYAPRSTAAWGRDVMCFLRLLFRDFGMHAVRWTVVVGNPAEDSYDRLVAKLGGHCYGRSRGSAVLQDGQRADHKLYEVLTEELNWNVMNRLCGDTYERRTQSYAQRQGDGEERQGGGDLGRRDGRDSGLGRQGSSQGGSDLRPEQAGVDSHLGGRELTLA